MNLLRQNIQEAKDYITKSFHDFRPEMAVILGSGLGALGDELDRRKDIDTSTIPHWPASTVQGHRGKVVSGYIQDYPVLILQGRSHYYEGYTIQEITFPLRVLGQLGIQHLIITNASGALNPGFSPGDLMLITDHINLMGTNPLIGINNPEFGPRFPDMTQAYDPDHIKLAVHVAGRLKIPVKKGILLATTGPSYETSAEVRMMKKMGGDAVCMSTVPEVIVGAQLGLKILGVSCITNMATGLSKTKLSHEEVKTVASRIQSTFISFMKEIILQIAVKIYNSNTA